MSDDIKYEGARFYKCALQVNPYSYAKYRGETPLDENAYNEQILEQCQKNEITVVGLADHGKVEDSESLRALLRDNEIIVFPGFEISSSEKIHMVCLYPETTEVLLLNQYLGQLMGSNLTELKEDPTYPSSLSCEKIAGHVLNNQNGFWYAAHMTNKNGLLRLSGAGDNYVHLWKQDNLVIAGQIPGTIDDLDVEETKLKIYQKIIKNKNLDYKRSRSIATINAKDINTPETLSRLSASCLIKMTNPTFSAFTQAFFDPKSRIRLNHQVPDRQYSFIESIKWQGAGFFEDNAIAFSRHLNAVIGGRGTGKSTLIESIRYALDLPDQKKDPKVQEAFRKNTLSNSQIILKVFSKAQQGNYYTISRRYGEAPVVENEQGEVSRLSPKDILPDIQLLGQNEILEIEQDESAKLDLIDNFLPDSDTFDANMAEIKRRLKTNRGKLISANAEFEQLDIAVREESKFKERVTQFEKLGITEKLKNTRLLEKENVIQAKIRDQFDFVAKWVMDYQEIFDLVFLKDVDLETLPNKASIAESRKILDDLQKALASLTEQASTRLQKAKNDYKTIESTWQAESSKIRDTLDQAITQLPEKAGKTGKELGAEYTDIIRRLMLIEKQKQAHVDQQKIVNTIESERSSLLEEYRNTAFSHFDAMNGKVEELNKGNLKGKVKISVVRCGNKDALKNFLLSIDGIGPTKIQWLDSEDVKLDLVEWSKWIKEQNADAFMDKYKAFGVNQSVSNTLTQLNLSKRLELEEIELKDKVSIELNTAHGDQDVRYVSLDKLSTGQKCTAILNLLLLSCDDPLIIDQPEDNLDNAFIAERIVKDLRQFKTTRQFLFATHNANIPVFGDAELIVVLENNQDTGGVKNIGSIDKQEVGSEAAEILEGGKAAFNKRKEKYGF